MKGWIVTWQCCKEEWIVNRKQELSGNWETPTKAAGLYGVLL